MRATNDQAYEHGRGRSAGFYLLMSLLAAAQASAQQQPTAAETYAPYAAGPLTAAIEPTTAPSAEPLAAPANPNLAPTAVQRAMPEGLSLHVAPLSTADTPVSVQLLSNRASENRVRLPYVIELSREGHPSITGNLMLGDTLEVPLPVGKYRVVARSVDGSEPVAGPVTVRVITVAVRAAPAKVVQGKSFTLKAALDAAGEKDLSVNFVIARDGVEERELVIPADRSKLEGRATLTKLAHYRVHAVAELGDVARVYSQSVLFDVVAAPLVELVADPLELAQGQSTLLRATARVGRTPLEDASFLFSLRGSDGDVQELKAAPDGTLAVSTLGAGSYEARAVLRYLNGTFESEPVSLRVQAPLPPTVKASTAPLPAAGSELPKREPGVLIAVVLALAAVVGVAYRMRKRAGAARRAPEARDPADAPSVELTCRTHTSHRIELRSPPKCAWRIGVRCVHDPGSVELKRATSGIAPKLEATDDEQGLTMRSVLPDLKPAEWVPDAVAQSSLFASIAARVPPGARDAIGSLISHEVDALLDMDLLGLFVGGWLKHRELAALANKPGDGEIVGLIDHELCSTHEPKIELMLNGQRLCTIPLKLVLELELRGVQLLLHTGAVREVRVGELEGKARVELADREVAKRSIRKLKLPGVMKLDPGIPLGGKPAS